MKVAGLSRITRSADPPVLNPALEFLLHRAKAVDVGDHVARHEADIVPVHFVLVARIAQAHPQLHGVWSVHITRKAGKTP
jgi:hypothetical protein